MKNGCSENQEHSLHDCIVFIGDPGFLLLPSTFKLGKTTPGSGFTVVMSFQWGEESIEPMWGLEADVHSQPTEPPSGPCYLLGPPHVWVQELCRCFSQVWSFVGMYALRLRGWPRNSTWGGCEWNECDNWAGALTCLYVRCLWCPIERAAGIQGCRL